METTPLAGLQGKYGTVLVDPPWRFQNRTGKMAPEHRRLNRYPTMTFSEIASLPVADYMLPQSHLYLWTPNALIKEAIAILEAWGFTYKTNLVWLKVRRDGGPDGRGVGFYFRNVTELVLFGVRGRLRTGPAGRRQVNAIITRKAEHSWKPDEQYEIIESCSPGPYLELFARRQRPNWTAWGNQADSYEESRPIVRGYNGHDMHQNDRGAGEVSPSKTPSGTSETRRPSAARRKRTARSE